MATDHSRVRVALRFWDWSEWGRQWLRGVRHFAHHHPEWRLYAMAGSAEFSSVSRARRGHWNGIITTVLNEVPL